MASGNGKYTGRGRDTRWKLARMKQQRPDLLAKYESGEISLSRAARQSGLEEERYSIARDPVKAARTILMRLPPEEIDDLVLALVHVQGRNYGLDAVAYVDELRAVVAEEG
jgi:hypothetical protein